MDAEMAKKRGGLVGHDVHHHAHRRAGNEVQHLLLRGDDLTEVVEDITGLIAGQALELVEHDHKGQPDFLLKDT